MPENETLKERIDRIAKEADRVSEAVRSAERLLQDVPCTEDVTFAYLMWDSKRKRIIDTTFENPEKRPLIECPLKLRVSRQSEISGLVDRVLMTTESFMEKMRTELA